MDSPTLRRLPCAALLLLLPACEQHVSECHELKGRLDPHTEAMVRAVENLARVESEPERLSALRAATDLADRELAAIRLEDPRLAGFAQRYREQLEDARRAAEAVRHAADAKDPAGLNAAAKQADAFLDAQATTLEELDRYCTGS